MATLHAGDIVTVLRLNLDSHRCLGRHPAAGETGRIRTVIEGDGFVMYIVEHLHSDGTVDWVCDFDEGDLGLLSRPE